MSAPHGPEYRPFYTDDLPDSMRFTPTRGAERQGSDVGFDPSIHLARLVNMSNQVTESAADEDGDHGVIIRAEIEALVDRFPELRDQLPN